MSEPAVTMRRPRTRTRGASLATVLGELLLTGGVLVMLFLGWQLWFNNVVSTSEQGQVAEGLSQQWAAEAPAAPSDPAIAPDPGTPVVTATPAINTAFANLIVPRLGADFKRPIAEGVASTVLNNTRLGMGHYSQTQLPGEPGNFALASHRSAYGGAFHNIHQLVVGDSIWVETADGWYRYIYRNTEYVRSSGIGVVLPVPQNPGIAATESIITLTTCNPFYSSAERIIAYGVFDAWYPRSGGPPAELALVTGAG